MCEISDFFTPEINAALISTFIAGGISLWTIRVTEKASLREKISKMIDYAVDHPELESDFFCETWTSLDRNSEKVQRYENYCCFVFNTLERIWEFCSGSKNRIDKIIYIEELIIRHAKWWETDMHNRAGYNPDFQTFVDEIIKKLKKEKNHEHNPTSNIN